MAYFFGFSVIHFKRYDISIVVLYYTKIYLQCDLTTFKAFLAHCGGVVLSPHACYGKLFPFAWNLRISIWRKFQQKISLFLGSSGASLNLCPEAAPAPLSLASQTVATDAVASYNFMNANDSDDVHPGDGNRVHRVDRVQHVDRAGCWHRHRVQRNHQRVEAA